METCEQTFPVPVVLSSVAWWPCPVQFGTLGLHLKRLLPPCGAYTRYQPLAYANTCVWKVKRNTCCRTRWCRAGWAWVG